MFFLKQCLPSTLNLKYEAHLLCALFYWIETKITFGSTNQSGGGFICVYFLLSGFPVLSKMNSMPAYYALRIAHSLSTALATVVFRIYILNSDRIV